MSLRRCAVAVCAVLALQLSLVRGQFSMLVQNNGTAPFNGRYAGGLVLLPYPLTYQNWSYVLSASQTTASNQVTNPPGLFTSSGAQASTTYQYTVTAPANSLYLFGGYCGHAANPSTPMGDLDVWTSSNGGVTWSLFGGAHGLSGTNNIYASALSANTPLYQDYNPAWYYPAAAAQSYGIYPGMIALHENVNRRFYLLGGDYYYGSGVWRPTGYEQNSGGTPTQNSTISGVPINLEGQGWTNNCLDTVGGTATYSFCDSFTVRTSAAGTTDSKGNIYIMNGVAAYDLNSYPWLLQSDVWVSSNGGLSWSQASATTPWSTIGNGRMESAATSTLSAYYGSDVIYSIGGCSTTSTGFNIAGSTVTEVGYNDVYASINQGQTWYTVTSTAAFSQRCGLVATATQSTATNAGVLVVVGGRTAQTYGTTGAGWPTYYTTTLGLTTLTDVWTSLDGGVTWYQLSATGGADRAAITLDINGFLHIVGGKMGLGQGLSQTACPSNTWISSQSLNSISTWLTSVSGLASATVPAATGLRVVSLNTTAAAAANPFKMTVLNGGAGFNGRSGGGLAVVSAGVTYNNWAYTVNQTYTTPNNMSTNPAGLFNPITGAQAISRPLQVTTTASSLFFWGGECGHGVSPSPPVSDPDVWASTDGGMTWSLTSGPHGLGLDTNTGTYGQYVLALSASTPSWQGSSPATYPASASPQSYGSYPGAVNLHDNVNHKFYVLAGESYSGGAHWNPTATVQSSGAPSASLLQQSTINNATINAEGVGWTNQCLQSSAVATYGSCGSFPARSSAGGVTDSKGNLYLMNGITAYDWSNDFPMNFTNDVWMSTNMGLSWTAQTLTAPWSVRFESGSATYLSTWYNTDVIYSVGGCSASSTGYGTQGTVAAPQTLVETPFNDVWASTTGGATWYTITAAAAWPARCGVTVSAASNGVLALVGGRKAQTYTSPLGGVANTNGLLNYFDAILGYYTLTDIWTSLDGGATWLQLSTTGGRDRPAMTFDSAGLLHVVSGRVTAGVGYLTPYACPSDSLASSLSFTTISSWVKTVPGLSGATVPGTLGLTTIIPGGGSSQASTACTTAFCIITQNNNSAPFAGRYAAGLATLPYPITYQNWSYVLSASQTTISNQVTNPPGLFTSSGAQASTTYQYTVTAPANSLYLFGGYCGHGVNALSTMGDPDVWTSPDGGVTWSLIGGAHGVSGTSTGNIYASALSANTPNMQSGNGASGLAGYGPPQFGAPPGSPYTYVIFPGSVPLHDNVNHRFYQLGGDYYYGSGIWRTTGESQNSGGYPSLNSTGSPVTALNLEGLGWTNQCLDMAGGTATYSFCDSFTARTAAAGTTDSKGNLYLMNGINAYDTNNLPWILLGDVWASTNGGVAWTQQSASAPWAALGTGGRMESAATSTYSTLYSTDVIYNIGGCGVSASLGFNVVNTQLTEVGYNDVYASITQGQTWYTVTTSAAFSPRCGLVAVSTASTASNAGVLVVVGGRTPQTYPAGSAGWPTYYDTVLGLTTLTDVWTSLDGGVTWYRLAASGGRDRAAITLDINGFLHIVGGKTGLGNAPNSAACPSDTLISSKSFNNISTWLTTVTGLTAAVVPATTGLRATLPTTVAANNFKLTPLNGGAGFNGRAGAGLFTVTAPVTYNNWAYTVNGTYTTPNNMSTIPVGLFNPITGAQAISRPLQVTTPANSLFLVGGECGHGVNPSPPVSDPDVWTSTDGGITWNLVSGPHGLGLDTNTGTYGQYVLALSASTPSWQGSSPATYPASASPQSYGTYPGNVPLHDNVNHKFYLLAGEYYAGSGHWNPTSIVQSSGAPSASLLQLSTISNATINAEGVGWTNQCLQSNGVPATYVSCGSFPARSSANGVTDSKGNLYVMNGISAYDWTNSFPQTLLNDVWMSSSQGLTWVQTTLTTPWAPRMESGAATYFSPYYNADVIYNIGGCSVNDMTTATPATLVESAFNDVYVSVNQGTTWTTVTTSAAFTPRCGVTVTAATNGALVLVGGRKPQTYTTLGTTLNSNGLLNYFESVLGYYTLTDIWTSLDGGYTWYMLSAVGGRDRPALSIDSTGLLHVVSGRVTAGVGYLTPYACPSDSYVSSQSFSSIGTWLTTVSGLSGATVPNPIGLTSTRGPAPGNTGAPSVASSAATSAQRAQSSATSAAVTPTSAAVVTSAVAPTSNGGNPYVTSTIAPTSAAVVTGPAGSSSSSSSLSGGAIAGIVIGSVAGALILCAIIMFFCFGASRKSKSTETNHSKFEDHAEESHTTHENETGDQVEMANV